eukprot:1066598-Rhodomonas_salina.3
MCAMSRQWQWECRRRRVAEQRVGSAILPSAPLSCYAPAKQCPCPLSRHMRAMQRPRSSTQYDTSGPDLAGAAARCEQGVSGRG